MGLLPYSRSSSHAVGISQAGGRQALIQAELWLVASIEAMTFINMPVAKNFCISSSSAPDRRATSRQSRPNSCRVASRDLVVVARAVEVHLQHELVAVAEQLAVCLAHRVHRVLAGEVTHGVDEGLANPAEAVGHEREEQRLLGREEPEEVRLADPGGAGDVLGRGAVVATLGERGNRRAQHVGTPLYSAHPGRWGHHGH